MKARVPVLIGLVTLVPIGIAVADYADTPTLKSQARGPMSEMLALGEQVVQGVDATRGRLAAATRKAREAGDPLLATCLEDKLDELDGLQTKAASQLSLLRSAQGSERANLPYVVLTVIGQKATQAGQEATRCVGGQQDTGPSAGEIAPPHDPNARQASPDDQFDPRLPPQGAALPIQPGPASGLSTSFSPATGDMPMDMPATPTAASPVQ